MSLLHDPIIDGDTSLIQHVFIKNLTSLDEIASQRFPSLNLTMTSASDIYLQHVDQNRSILGIISNSTIYESQSDVIKHESCRTDITCSTSTPAKCMISSANNNILATTPRNSGCPHNYKKAHGDYVDNRGFESNFRNSPTISAEYKNNIQSVTLMSDVCTSSLNDKWDYVHSTQPNEQHWFRKRCSATYSRAHVQLPSLFQNVKRKDIVFGAVIGKGGFGKVHTGHIHGRAVAIKVVQKRRGSGIHREILQAERLAFSLNLRHENIVSILGVNLCDGFRGDALIVMELVSPQTLQSVLDDNTRVVTQSQRLNFALQITEALNYLHTNEVVHLDVKPRNVLMTKENTCKLADFGSLMRTRKDAPREETEFTQLLGTLPYRAPELMKGCFPSSKSDIFSLGITLWQLATRETPHSGANPHWLIYQVTKGNKRPDHHDTGSSAIEVKYRDLYTACWDAEPELRPHACDVIVSLSTLLQCVGDGGWSEVVKRNE